MQGMESQSGMMDFAGVDLILVLLANRRKTGMESESSFFRREYSYRTREHSIQAAQKIVAVDSRSGVKMGDHTVGMNTRIGPTGAIQQDNFFGHPAEEMLNFALNSSVVFLALPAAKFGAVVADH